MAFLHGREQHHSSDLFNSNRLPRGISIRRGGADDEAGAFDVMRRTMNAEMSWTNHAPTRHHLRNSPNASFWVAEDSPRFGSSRIVGYARSVVRDKVWSLTEFFVLPSQHRQGVGRTLLERCMEDGDADGADTRIVLASHHPDADALYIKRLGCLPLVPMMLLSGSPTTLRAPEPLIPIKDEMFSGLYSESYFSQGSNLNTVSIVAEPIVASDRLLTEMSALDREIVGYARPTEHQLWINEMGGEHGGARIFWRSQGGAPPKIVGYSYVGVHSSGPTLAVIPEDQARFFYHVSCTSNALHRGTSEFEFSYSYGESPDQFCAVAGTNSVMLRWLLSNKWHIVFQYLFMSTRPLGQQDRYVCHNPLYVM